LDAIAGRNRTGLREPVIVALDITTINFWPSPLKDEEDVEPDEEPLETDKGDVYPRDDYPEMASGFKENSERGYKFATITVVAEDTPIVVGIEPVRDYSWWEREDREDVATASRADIVRRLLEQAEQHVDIHKAFADREFSSHEVRDIIDEKEIDYVIGKVRNETDIENIEETLDDPVYDGRIEHAWQRCDGRKHKVSIVYLPNDDADDESKYSIFSIRGWIGNGWAKALTNQYRKRWTIGNQYKTIKQYFIPQIASKDYGIRFLYFVIGVILHNVWRLANFQLRDELERDLGESPPIPAGELVELVAFLLFDPGD